MGDIDEILKNIEKEEDENNKTFHKEVAEIIKDPTKMVTKI